MVGFTARFTIDSVVAQISGTKSFLRTALVQCGPDPEGVIEGDFGGETMLARYEATIATALGTFRDQGNSGIGFGISEFATGATSASIQQSYTSHREVSILLVEPVESINAVGTTHTVTALLRDPLPEPIAGERVTQLVVVGTHATFFGQAEVNGVATNYRIDVQDLTSEDEGGTFVIQTDTGYTAGGVVTNGNVRVSSG